MFKRILVPLDGSSLAECVLPHVIAVSQAFGSGVLLLSAVNHEGFTDGHPVDPVDWQARRAGAETYLQEIAGKLEKMGLTTEWAILEGPPAESIVDTSHSHGIDLIVLSTHGQAGLTHWTSGSVVRKVVQRAFGSLLIVRAFRWEISKGLSAASYRRIFLPLDGSQRAECVLPLAIRIAQFHEAEVTLTHAVSKPEMPCRGPMSEEDSELQRRLVERNRKVANEYLESIGSRLPPRFRTRLVVSMDVASSLHDLARIEASDLVVLSAHGYSGQRKWPYGSVCRSFIEYGTSPLLVLQDLSYEEVEATEAELVAQERKGH